MGHGTFPHTRHAARSRVTRHHHRNDLRSARSKRPPRNSDRSCRQFSQMCPNVDGTGQATAHRGELAKAKLDDHRFDHRRTYMKQLLSDPLIYDWDAALCDCTPSVSSRNSCMFPFLSQSGIAHPESRFHIPTPCIGWVTFPNQEFALEHVQPWRSGLRGFPHQGDTWHA